MKFAERTFVPEIIIVLSILFLLFVATCNDKPEPQYTLEYRSIH